MVIKENQGHHQKIRAFLIIILGLVVATALGFWLRRMDVSETNMVVVYILSVILISRLTPGYLWGIIAAVLATAAFNYFFTSPFHSFSVDDPTYWITFFIKFIHKFGLLFCSQHVILLRYTLCKISIIKIFCSIF